MTTTAPITTTNLNSKLTLDNKQKPDVSKPTTSHNAAISTQTKFTQRTILESYTDLTWYNSPAISHKVISQLDQKANCNNTLSTQTKMPFTYAIPGFEPLLNDIFIEVRGTIKCGTHLTDVQVINTDYKLGEPNAKPIKNETLPESIYASIATAFTPPPAPHLNVPKINQTMVALMDMELQSHRSQKHNRVLQIAAADLVDLIDDSDTANNSTPPAIIPANDHTMPAVQPPWNTTTKVTVTPIKAAVESATTKKQTPVKRAIDFGSGACAYNWNSRPLGSKNYHYSIGQTVTTLRTKYSGTMVSDSYNWNSRPLGSKTYHHSICQTVTTLRTKYSGTMVSDSAQPHVLTCTSKNYPRTSL